MKVGFVLSKISEKIRYKRKRKMSLITNADILSKFK